MSDLHQRAVGQRGALERLMGMIPGYQGYLDLETRRDVDKVQREHCAKTLLAQKERIKRVLNGLISGGQIDGIEPFERLLNKLDALAQRIRNADRGYSGLFDTLKVDQDVLDRVYEYDLSLAEAVAEVEHKIGELGAAAREAAITQASEVGQLLERVGDFFAKREEILRKGS